MCPGPVAPLFDAYGWADDEFSWTNITSHFGGTIMCSFASPNFSFWRRLPLPDGRSTARKLPLNDRGIKLDKSKYCESRLNPRPFFGCWRGGRPSGRS